MNFEDITWHDMVIKNIIINRDDPGRNDSIRFEVDGNRERIRQLIFEEVYWARLDLNFGVVAEETVFDAFLSDESDKDLLNLYSRWKGMIEGKKLLIFNITLNSTGSILKIIASHLTVVA
ncbi:hypothetical protein [Parapedobacter sp. DT-150]|uniref:hypothetical protein n=1 Tax=Parapedobacter sp. DT-150 TaxID=3396162 RepID=UPI003F1B8761